MSLLGFIKDVALLPLDATIDFMTLGGTINDSDPKILKRLESMNKNLEDTYHD